MLFVKNRGKETLKEVEDFDGKDNRGPKTESKEPSDKPKEGYYKDFDRQGSISSPHCYGDSKDT